MWTELDHNSNYSNIVRWDMGGNAFFSVEPPFPQSAPAAPGLEMVNVLSEGPSEKYGMVLCMIFTSFFPTFRLFGNMEYGT